MRTNLEYSYALPVIVESESNDDCCCLAVRLKKKSATFQMSCVEMPQLYWHPIWNLRKLVVGSKKGRGGGGNPREEESGRKGDWDPFMALPLLSRVIVWRDTGRWGGYRRWQVWHSLFEIHLYPSKICKLNVNTLTFVKFLFWKFWYFFLKKDKSRIIAFIGRWRKYFFFQLPVSHPVRVRV